MFSTGFSSGERDGSRMPSANRRLSTHWLHSRPGGRRHELLPNLDGAVKSRFLMRVGWIIIVHVYFTRPTDWGIV